MRRATSTGALLLALVFAAGAASAQALQTTCLPDGNDGDGLQLVVDARGTLHLARVDRVPGTLLHSTITPDDAVDDAVVLQRMSRLFDDEVRDLGLAVSDGGEVALCAYDAVRRVFGVALYDPDGWRFEDLDDGAGVGATCAIERVDGRWIVAWAGDGQLRAARSTAAGWAQAVPDAPPGVDVGSQPDIAAGPDGALAIVHLDRRARLRITSTTAVGAIDTWRWSTIEAEPGGWSPAAFFVGPVLHVYHGTPPDDPHQGGDAGAWSTVGPPGGPLRTGAEPGIDLGGSLDATALDGTAWFFVRQRTRSAVFGQYDGLFLDTGPAGEGLERVSIDESGPAGRRHTWRHLQVDLDPFGSPVLAWFDELGGFFGDPPTARVCYARAADTDADAVPDHVEIALGLDPSEPDTDGDGRTDGEELLVDGTDPGGEVPCVAEVCNAVDDDCDGVVDEGLDAAACDTGADGRCAVGRIACLAGDLICVPLEDARAEACDGVDDDCDGFVDEGQQRCGEGACAVEQPICRDGAPAPCVPDPPLGDDETCDAIDDDCDGLADEEWAPDLVECGVGACLTVVDTECIVGQIEDACEPGLPAPDDTSCDGFDTDCDGAVDEDAAPIPVECGIGACTRAGAARCEAGERVEQCTPGAPAADDTTCDGVDDDCDGRLDEDVEPVATVCGVGACAAEGVRACVVGRLVDGCTPGVASPDETCDGVDDDCDGRLDEGFSAVARCGVGACEREGVAACLAGRPVEVCTPGVAAADDATCDGEDDDCDGRADEDAAVAPIECGVGACVAAGERRCVGGAVSDVCAPGVPAAVDRTCDGIDDDCDGAADEDADPIPVRCGVGACRADGVERCVLGARRIECTPGVAAAVDRTCDRVDDDCDGRVDEDDPDCACDGVDDDCDGVDEDCDGVVDEAAPCPCDAVDDGCDGVDDDCDGVADEGFVGAPVTCGVGACRAAGEQVCVDGVVVDDCVVGEPAESDLACDGVDDDCDGATDEGFVGGAYTCGVGACVAQGERRCVEGRLIERCRPGAGRVNDPTCNGVDDDCDGSTDEGAPALVITCGVGACAAEGIRACRRGRYRDGCTPGEPTGADDDCDGIDQDCDGVADEGFVGGEVGCGLGACAARGVEVCRAGAVGADCSPAPPADADAECDGIDQDCDGVADEDYVAQPLRCGVGACAADGLTVCVDGTVAEVCAPGAAGSDDDCDGVDGDCDGAADEGWLPDTITCGRGACARDGEQRCVAGTVVEDCTPGEPGPFDAECDGRDADCDGRLDEDFVGELEVCGVGACRRTARDRCPDGFFVDATCRPGVPGLEQCGNGVDDDCDEAVDEGCVIEEVDAAPDAGLVDAALDAGEPDAEPVRPDAEADGALVDAAPIDAPDTMSAPDLGLLDDEGLPVDVGEPVSGDLAVPGDAVAEGGAPDIGVDLGGPIVDGEVAPELDRAPPEPLPDALTLDRDPPDAVRLDYALEPLDSLIPPREYDCLGRIAPGSAPVWPLLAVVVTLLGLARRSGRAGPGA